MFEYIATDIKAYNATLKGSSLKRFVLLCFTQELYPVLIYRYGRWVECRCRYFLIKKLFGAVYFLLQVISQTIFHVYISPAHEIGPGLRLEHFGYRGIVAKIGKNCRIQQLVVIGHVGGFRSRGVPILGDNVYIGVGAKILGNIKVGNNVVIGANSVVVKDVPDNAVVGGVPAKIIKIQNEAQYQEKFY